MAIHDSWIHKPKDTFKINDNVEFELDASDNKSFVAAFPTNIQDQLNNLDARISANAEIRDVRIDADIVSAHAYGALPMSGGISIQEAFNQYESKIKELEEELKAEKEKNELLEKRYVIKPRVIMGGL